MPRRRWLDRVDEASGRVLAAAAVLAGLAAALAVLACLGLIVAGVVRALVPYWPCVLGAFGLLVVLPMTITRLEARFEAPPPDPDFRPDPIDWHLTTSFRCRCCGHNWTSHGLGEGSCSVYGAPYTTETSVGWEGDIIQTESGTPCGCPHYEGIEPD